MNFIEGVFRPISSRGIRLDTCKKFNYQVAKIGEQQAHIAHYRTEGDMVHQHIRLVDEKDFFWVGDDVQKVKLFGQDIWRPGGKRLVITEGEIDALTIAQAFNLSWQVVSVPSGAQSAVKYIKQQLEWCDSFGDIVLAFDDDEPGRAARDDVAALFAPGKVRIMDYQGYKDANELHLKNPKAVGTAVFDAKPWRPDGIVEVADTWDMMEEEVEIGLELPYPILQRKLRGVRPGRLFIFTAGSGIGKSTFVHEMGYHLAMQHNQTLGILALEESVKKAVRRHVGIHMNKNLSVDNADTTTEERRVAWEETAGNGRYFFYKHFGSTQIDNLLAKIRYMVVGLGCRFIILDHISIVVSGLDIGENERKTIDVLMTRLRSFIEETGCSILAIVHLKRPRDGKSYNEGRPVALTDLRGSGSLEQLSDVIISLERNQQDEEMKNISQTRLLKDRDLGDTGLADQIAYQQDTGRMIVHEGSGEDYGFDTTGNDIPTRGEF